MKNNIITSIFLIVAVIVGLVGGSYFGKLVYQLTHEPLDIDRTENIDWDEIDIVCCDGTFRVIHDCSGDPE